MIWARIETENPGPGMGYGWREVVPMSGGRWDFGTQSGSANAYPINPCRIPVGTIVQLWPTHSGEWRFQHDRTS